MERQCPVCLGDGSNCYLKNILKDQAANGGFVSISLDPSMGVAGRYWKRSVWNNLIKRTKDAANNGCLHSFEVKELAKDLTTQKLQASELVDKP